MSRHEISVETKIEAPPTKVFRILSDPGRVPQWMPNASAAEPTNDKKGVGATRHVQLQVQRTVLESYQRIVEAEEGKRFAWVHERDLIDGKPFGMLEDVGTAFRLRGDGRRTRLTATSHFKPKGFKARLAAPLFTNDIKKQMRFALDNLKRLAEA